MARGPLPRSAARAGGAAGSRTARGPNLLRAERRSRSRRSHRARGGRSRARRRAAGDSHGSAHERGRPHGRELSRDQGCARPTRCRRSAACAIHHGVSRHRRARGGGHRSRLGHRARYRARTHWPARGPRRGARHASRGPDGDSGSTPGGPGLGICAVVGIVGILHGQPIGLMLETAISLAVAAIPEGLPAITTVALAACLWRLARDGALVRRLSAVETLGSTTVICTDKTGTMTENQMTVTRLVLDGRCLDVSGGARSPVGVVSEAGKPVDVTADAHLQRLLTTGVLVNDAHATPSETGLVLDGDPTETALLVAALKAGLDPAALRSAWPRRREIPFDPAARLMSTFHEDGKGRRVLFVKGGPGAVLDLCTRRQDGPDPVPLADMDRASIRGANDALAAEALRVLAIAWRPDGWPANGRPSDLVFLGLVGLVDPVRPEVETAIDQCARAGIRTIMLTGDQRPTAEAVGRQLGLAPEAIRSRVTPEGKMRLVEELQNAGEVVAMTGDGVNDAPALARADIGVAMGRAGTDVAREAADLVLTDDNFATIVRAVEQGRVIYANLRKTVHFLFSCNLSEILTIFVAILLGNPTPLLPLQILWVNLVTDTVPALALVRDPAEPGVMARPPRDPSEALVTWRFGLRILVEGILLAAGVLGVYLWVVLQEGPGPRATTVAFVAIVLIHPLQAMYCRSDRLAWWRLPGNHLSWLVLGLLIAVQWTAVEWGPKPRTF